MTQLLVTNQENSYKIKLNTVVSQPATMFNWQLDVYPEGAIKTLDTAIDMKAIRDLMQEVMKMTGGTSTMRNVVTHNNQGTVYRSHYHTPEHNTHTLMIQSPSRSMEGRVKYSSSEVNLRFHPNKEMRNTKYEIGVVKTNHYDGRTHYEGRVSHPSLTKDISAQLEYSATLNGAATGSFELDIFPDTADKLKASLHSILIANNTIRVEAELQSRVS